MDHTKSKIPATSRTPTSSVRGLGEASNIRANMDCNHWRNPPSTVTAVAFAEAALTEADGLASGVEDSFAAAAFGRAEPVSDGAKTGVASGVGTEEVCALLGAAWVVWPVGRFPVVPPAPIAPGSAPRPRRMAGFGSVACGAPACSRVDSIGGVFLADRFNQPIS